MVLSLFFNLIQGLVTLVCAWPSEAIILLRNLTYRHEARAIRQAGKQPTRFRLFKGQVWVSKTAVCQHPE